MISGSFFAKASFIGCFDVKQKAQNFIRNINFASNHTIMSNLSSIKRPVEDELRIFEKRFKKSMSTDIKLLDIVLRYVLRKNGKKIRPTLVLLSSRILGNVTESSYTAATLIELLHTASLIHDDVVDESYERRNSFSLNALWRSKISVLVGDFLLSKGLLISIEKKEYELLEIVSEAVKQMSEGELLQIRKARKLDITMDQYFEIIEKKTAALISACTACGAKAAGESDEIVQIFKTFGRNLGIAFQIKDDLLDYQRNSLTGKPAANDIKEKKMTLPLIYALNNSDKKEASRIIKVIRKRSKDKSVVNKVIAFVESNGGLDYARLKMMEYKDKSVALINEFPKSAARDSMIELVNFTVNRNK